MTESTSDELVLALGFDDTVRIVAVTSTVLCQTALDMHDTYPTATAALGRALTGAALMGGTLKDGARISLQFQGDGPFGMLLTRSNDQGHVYGTIAHPQIAVPPRLDGKLDVGGGVGRHGTLMVSKDLGFGEPYVGLTPIQTGEIGDEISAYYRDSEQVQSVVGVGVLLTPERVVSGAGGFLVQVLGGATEDTLNELQATLESLRALSSEIEAGLTAEKLLERLTGGNFRILERRSLDYRCPHDREYYLARLTSLDSETLDEAFEEDERIEVVCEFTRTAYHYTRADIEAARG